MVFVKVVKNKAYFKRFQTQFRRRREGKTDYRARQRLVIQDKNKYNSPKYRFVVRFTNRDIVCQIAYAKIDGDHILAAAYSHELTRFGVKLGLTNYAAAYATGLLLARRVLKKLNLDSKYEGVKKVNGEDYNVEELDDGPRPFKALLDVGLVRTSTGARVFAALKGMCDGGVNVPHSETRFVGFNGDKKELNAAVLRKYIFGGHVAAYMKLLKEQDAAAFDRQFSRYAKEGVTADMLEKIYTEAHKQIRADPTFVPKRASKPEGAKPKHWGKRRLTYHERKNRVAQKKVRLGYPDAPKSQ
eukprot:m51a1_g9944 putative 60S ribosomal protein L18 (300) ;mRNA; r:15729-17002